MIGFQPIEMGSNPIGSVCTRISVVDSLIDIQKVARSIRAGCMSVINKEVLYLLAMQEARIRFPYDALATIAKLGKRCIEGAVIPSVQIRLVA